MVVHNQKSRNQSAQKLAPGQHRSHDNKDFALQAPGAGSFRKTAFGARERHTNAGPNDGAFHMFPRREKNFRNHAAPADQRAPSRFCQSMPPPHPEQHPYDPAESENNVQNCAYPKPHKNLSSTPPSPAQSCPGGGVHKDQSIARAYIAAGRLGTHFRRIAIPSRIMTFSLFSRPCGVWFHAPGRLPYLDRRRFMIGITPKAFSPPGSKSVPYFSAISAQSRPGYANAP